MLHLFHLFLFVCLKSVLPSTQLEVDPVSCARFLDLLGRAFAITVKACSSVFAVKQIDSCWDQTDLSYARFQEMPVPLKYTQELKS